MFGQPPAGATFDPNTTADPGFVNRLPERGADQTVGPANRGVDPSGNARPGHDILDTESFDIQSGFTSIVPDFHIVQNGDTLWDICDYYFRDPYDWPRVWSFNQQITNAHWIFPGDRIRLTDPDGQDRLDADTGLAFEETQDLGDGPPKTFLLNRYAFVEDDELAKAMVVVGGHQSKVMMSTLDTAYVGYKPDNPPIAGERLTVYRPKTPVYDIKVKGKQGRRQKKGKRIGWLVEVVGEVYVNEVAKKSADTTVVESVRPVERGMKVGELKTRFVRVDETPSEVTDNGLVVDSIRQITVNGEENFVVVNMGATRGIKRGNILDVVRKGDEYSPKHRLISPYEEGHPRRVVAQILVLQVEANTALGVLVESQREVTKGDHVEIRAPGMERSDQPSRRRGASADGRVDSRDGGVEAGGSLRVGG